MNSIDIQRIRSLCSPLLDNAATEARALQHAYLGIEHLFIALSRIPGGETARLLSFAGTSDIQTREDIRREIGKGREAMTGFPPFTPRLAKVLKLAEQRADIGKPILEQHLLEAMLEEEENLAARYLSSLGVDYKAWAEQSSVQSSNETCFSPSLDAEGTMLSADAYNPAHILPVNDGAVIQPGPIIKPMLDRHFVMATPTLDKYGRDLNKQAQMGKLTDAVSREAEIEQIITILARTHKANPILLGEPGVGKTAIIEGLAWRIANGLVPDVIKGKRIIQVDMGELTAGTELRGQFERRVKQIVKEASEAPNIILFIDEIHTIIGAGQGMYSALDAAQMFKPALTRGDFSCIGATTENEYFRFIRRDAALERRFSPVIIRELSEEVTLSILEKAVERIINKQAEAGHQLTLSPDVVMTALKLTDLYIRDRNQPDKSIDAIDLACAKAVIKGTQRVTAEDTARVISEWTGIPVSRMTSDDKHRFARMEEVLNTRVIGQKHAVSAVSQAIRSALSGMKSPHRPVGVFLFLGPTGVGKTKLAKELAAFLFQSAQTLVRFDMNEYKEIFSISNLVGSSKGYVGSEQGGLLSEALRKRPYSVVLLDEIDKAHPDILDLFLSIFDEGRITDNQGRVVDCSNALFVMTSNYSFKEPKIGFAFSEHTEIGASKNNEMREKVLEFMRPELVNRITEIIAFPPLEHNSFREILDIILKERLKEFSSTQLMKINLTVEDSAKELILELGYDAKMGARSLERAIEQILINPFADILYDRNNDSTAYKAVAEDGHILFIPSEDACDDENIIYDEEEEEIDDYEEGFDEDCEVDE